MLHSFFITILNVFWYVTEFIMLTIPVPPCCNYEKHNTNNKNLQFLQQKYTSPVPGEACQKRNGPSTPNK